MLGYYLRVLVFAYGYSLNWLTKTFTTCPKWHNFTGSLDEALDFILILRELIPQLLHLLEQIFTLVQLKVGLGKVRVESVLSFLHPTLGHGTFAEELQRGRNMALKKWECNVMIINKFF